MAGIRLSLSKATITGPSFSEIVPNGRCDLGSLNSVVAVFSGRVAIVQKFCNLQF